MDGHHPGLAKPGPGKRPGQGGYAEKRGKYRLIFKNAPLGFLHFDSEGRITACNDRFVDSLGSSREKLIGLNMLDLPDQQIVSALRDAISGKHGFFNGWYHAVTAENVIRARVFFAPLTDENGIIHGGMGIVEDTTEHERMAEEKARLEEQYRQAQKVESIGRLAGGVAHDFNNLLSPILGYAEMLASDPGAGDTRQKFAEEILYAGSRARDLVRKLLAFGRKQSMEYVPVDMNHAVSNFEKLLRRTIREDMTLELSLSPDIPMVKADIGQIEQVIMNLAINAVDAMPNGGRLTIETAAADLDDTYTAARPDIRPDRHLMLAVSDTGFGMDEETRTLLFEPFFSTKGEQGTGLGLSTVYGIVKQHGGSIWADSEPDAGTAMKIFLPAADDCTAAEDNTRQDTEGSFSEGSETLLLAEDDPQVRELAHAVLTRQGYTVLASENGDIAMKVMAQHEGPVHLLLTDVVMPEINGRELFAKIAKKHPGLKVLYISGYTADVVVNRGIPEKGAAFLQKPFSIKDLTAKVREVLDRETDQNADS
ncbi:MAG: response regulator [Desulfobacterales bacterium]|nr:response regulator [Desulfobacterales bacterium]